MKKNLNNSNKRIAIYIIFFISLFITKSAVKAEEADLVLPKYFKVSVGEVLDLGHFEENRYRHEKNSPDNISIERQLVNNLATPNIIRKLKPGWDSECITLNNSSEEMCIPIVATDRNHNIQNLSGEDIYIEQNMPIIWSEEAENEDFLKNIVQEHMNLFKVNISKERMLELEPIDSDSVDFDVHYQKGNTFANLQIFLGSDLIYDDIITVYNEFYKPSGEGWEILPLDSICPSREVYKGYGADVQGINYWKPELGAEIKNVDNIGNPLACGLYDDDEEESEENPVLKWLKEDITALNPINKSYLQILGLGEYLYPLELFKNNMPTKVQLQSNINDSFQGPFKNLKNYQIFDVNKNKYVYEMFHSREILPFSSIRQKFNGGFNAAGYNEGGSATGSYTLVKDNNGEIMFYPLVSSWYGDRKQDGNYGIFEDDYYNDNINIWINKKEGQTISLAIVKPFTLQQNGESKENYIFQNIITYNKDTGYLDEESIIYNNNENIEHIGLLNISKHDSTMFNYNAEKIAAIKNGAGGNIGISRPYCRGMENKGGTLQQVPLSEKNCLKYTQLFDSQNVLDWKVYKEQFPDPNMIYDQLSKGNGYFNPNIPWDVADINNNLITYMSPIMALNFQEAVHLKTSFILGDNYFLQLSADPDKINVYDNEIATTPKNIELTTRDEKGVLIQDSNIYLYVNKEEISKNNTSSIQYKDIEFPQIPNEPNINTNYYTFQTKVIKNGDLYPSNIVNVPVSVYKFGAQLNGGYNILPNETKIATDHIIPLLDTYYIKDRGDITYKWIDSKTCNINKNGLEPVNNQIIGPKVEGNYSACLSMEQINSKQSYNIIIPIHVENKVSEQLILYFQNDIIEVSEGFEDMIVSAKNRELLGKSNPFVRKGNEIIDTYKKNPELFEVKSIDNGKANICYKENTCNIVKYIEEGYIPEENKWLPTYSKWKAAGESIISKENAFTMMYSEDTEVVEWSDGISKTNTDDIKKATNIKFPVNEGPQWVKWKNVGYYQGNPVDLKLTVSDFGNTSINSAYNKIYLSGEKAFSVELSKKIQKLSVNYEFFNSNTGEPISVTGYWNLSMITDAKIITIPTNQIEDIYSISRDGKDIDDVICTTCTLLSYDIVNQDGKELMNITGHGHLASGSIPNKPNGIQKNQLQTTFTYKDKKNITFNIESAPNNPFDSSFVGYNSEGLVQVAIPDPEPLDQKIDTITPKNRDKLTNEFIQYIPFEPVNKRNQSMKWEIPKNTTIDIFKPGSWEIINEKGENKTDLFNIIEQGNSFSIVAKNIKDANLYNHMYKFKYPLLFNEDKQIRKDQVEQSNYLPYEQVIDFKVNNENTVQIKTKTDINMNATVTYKYLDITKKEISSEEKKSGLITDPYPITEAKHINKYAFQESIPNNLSQEKLKYTNSSVEFIYEKGLSWLPTYSRWKDAEESIIPKENSFMMMYSEDTEVVEWSEGISKANEGDIKNTIEAVYPVDQGPQWVKWKNVGYYQGNPVDLKLTVSNFGNTRVDNKTSNKIHLKGSRVFSVRMSKETQKVSVNYEFFNSNTGEPISVTGVWNLRNINTGQAVTMPTNQIENIYSMSRDGKGINDMTCTTCTLLSYDIVNQNGKEMMSIIGNGNPQNGGTAAKPPGMQEQQIRATFTYKDKANITFDISSTSQNPFSDAVVFYNSEGLVKVAIPDPEPLDQKIDTITPENRDKLTNEFIQYIPFEPVNKRNQNMKWEIPKNKTIDIFKPGSWEIINEKGENKTDLFNIVEQDNRFSIVAKDINNSNLYNHMYKFKYTLLFNEGKEIQKDQLNPNNHLIYEQVVDFKVNNESTVQIKTKTDINMNASVTYEYLDNGSGKPIKEAIVEKGLITHKIPKIPDSSKEIENYTFVRSEPHNYQDTIILYSDQSVKLYYAEQLSTIVVPESLKFEDVNSVKKSSIIERSWPIEVYHSKSNSWYVQVSQKTPLMLEDKNYDICGINEAPCFEYKTKEQQKYLSMDNPISLNKDEFLKNNNEYILDWGNQSDTTLLFNGFKAYQYALNGSYTSILEFQLINAY